MAAGAGSEARSLPPQKEAPPKPGANGGAEAPKAPRGQTELKIVQAAEPLKNDPDAAFRAIGEVPDLPAMKAGGGNEADAGGKSGQKKPAVELAAENGERVGRFKEESADAPSPESTGKNNEDLMQLLKTNPALAINMLAKPDLFNAAANDNASESKPDLAKKMTEQGGEPGLPGEQAAGASEQRPENATEKPKSERELAQEALKTARDTLVDKRRGVRGLIRSIKGSKDLAEANDAYDKAVDRYKNATMDEVEEKLQDPSMQEKDADGRTGAEKLMEETLRDLTSGEWQRLKQTEADLQEKRLAESKAPELLKKSYKKAIEKYRDTMNAATNALVGKDAGALKKMAAGGVVGIGISSVTGGLGGFMLRPLGIASSAESFYSGSEFYAKHRIEKTQEEVVQQDVSSIVDRETGKVDMARARDTAGSRTDRLKDQYKHHKWAQAGRLVGSAAAAVGISTASRSAGHYFSEQAHEFLSNTDTGRSIVEAARGITNQNIITGRAAGAAAEKIGHGLMGSGVANAGEPGGTGITGGGGPGGHPAETSGAAWYDDAKDKLSAAAGKTEDAINNSEFGKNANEAVKEGWNELTRPRPDIAQEFQNAAHSVAEDVGKAGDAAGKIINNIKGSEFGKTFSEQADKAWENTKATGRTIGGWADKGEEFGAKEKAWELKQVDQAVDRSPTLKSAVETASDAWKTVESTAGEAWDKAGNSEAGRGLSDLWKQATVPRPDIAGEFKGAASHVGEYMQKTAPEVWSDIKDTGSKAWDAVHDAAVQNAKISEAIYNSAFGTNTAGGGGELAQSPSGLTKEVPNIWGDKLPGAEDQIANEFHGEVGKELPDVKSSTGTPPGEPDQTLAATETTIEATHAYVVKEGDALERIIRHDLKASHPGLDSDLREKMIRHMLHKLPEGSVPSGNPDLIHPGEKLDLTKIMGSREQIDEMIKNPDSLKVHISTDHHGHGSTESAGHKAGGTAGGEQTLHNDEITKKLNTFGTPESARAYYDSLDDAGKKIINTRAHDTSHNWFTQIFNETNTPDADQQEFIKSHMYDQDAKDITGGKYEDPFSADAKFANNLGVIQNRAFVRFGINGLPQDGESTAQYLQRIYTMGQMEHVNMDAPVADQAEQAVQTKGVRVPEAHSRASNVDEQRAETTRSMARGAELSSTQLTTAGEQGYSQQDRDQLGSLINKSTEADDARGIQQALDRQMPGAKLQSVGEVVAEPGANQDGGAFTMSRSDAEALIRNAEPARVVHASVEQPQVTRAEQMYREAEPAVVHGPAEPASSNPESAQTQTAAAENNIKVIDIDDDNFHPDARPSPGAQSANEIVTKWGSRDMVTDYATKNGVVTSINHEPVPANLYTAQEKLLLYGDANKVITEDDDWPNNLKPGEKGID